MSHPFTTCFYTAMDMLDWSLSSRRKLLCLLENIYKRKLKQTRINTSAVFSSLFRLMPFIILYINDNAYKHIILIIVYIKWCFWWWLWWWINFFIFSKVLTCADLWSGKPNTIYYAVINSLFVTEEVSLLYIFYIIYQICLALFSYITYKFQSTVQTSTNHKKDMGILVNGAT